MADVRQLIFGMGLYCPTFSVATIAAATWFMAFVCGARCQSCAIRLFHCVTSAVIEVSLATVIHWPVSCFGFTFPFFLLVAWWFRTSFTFPRITPERFPNEWYWQRHFNWRRVCSGRSTSGPNRGNQCRGYRSPRAGISEWFGNWDLQRRAFIPPLPNCSIEAGAFIVHSMRNYGPTNDDDRRGQNG